MSNIKSVLLLLALGLVILFGLTWMFGQENPVNKIQKLGGGPQISSASVVNSSSSLTTAAGGAVLWTNASSTGDWFKISNTSAFRVWCALDSSTSTVNSLGGVLLFPSTSSTGESVWEMWGARGAVACAPNGGTALITFSYSAQ